MAKKIPPFQIEDHSLLSSDGASSLFLRHYSRGKPKLHFFIIHGALEHLGRHIDLTNFLLKNYNDVAVTLYDHIGHGKSGGSRAYVENFQQYLDDLMIASEFVYKKNGEGVQTFICAHSLGGLITLTRLLDSTHPYPYPVKGVILSSPCIKPQTVLAPIAKPILDKLDKFTPKLRLPMIYSGEDLTHDADRANDFETDSLIPKFITVRMAKEINDQGDKIKGLSYYMKIPSLFLVAGADKVVVPESTILFAHGIDKRLTEIIQYPKHHHELWNEIDRESIFETMRKWVDKQLKESL